MSTDAGAERRPDDPPFGVIVGETNLGKTVETIYSWGANALFLAQPNAVVVAKTVCGYDISNQIYPVSSVEECIDVIPSAKAQGWSAVVIDDLSLLMKTTAALAADRHKVMVKKDGKEREGYDFAMYTDLASTTIQLSNVGRWAGIPVIASAHVQPPFFHTKKKVQYPEGPDLSWKPLVRVLPHASDFCLFAAQRPPGAPAWDTRADCDRGNVLSTAGDRYNLAPPKGGPLNTGELVREASRRYGLNYYVPRPIGMEWMEDVAEHVAQYMCAGHEQLAVTTPWKEHLRKDGRNELHVAWALRDGVHRARFRMHADSAALAGF